MKVVDLDNEVAVVERLIINEKGHSNFEKLRQEHEKSMIEISEAVKQSRKLKKERHIKTAVRKTPSKPARIAGTDVPMHDQNNPREEQPSGTGMDNEPSSNINEREPQRIASQVNDTVVIDVDAISGMVTSPLKRAREIVDIDMEGHSASIDQSNKRLKGIRPIPVLTQTFTDTTATLVPAQVDQQVENVIPEPTQQAVNLMKEQQMQNVRDTATDADMDNDQNASYNPH